MTDNQIGVALANRLGLDHYKRQGHDLVGPCITCSSSDAFRLHQQTGIAHCFSCNGKWSPFQVAETVLGDRERAKSLMVELGLFEPRGNGTPNACCADPLELIARQKRISPQSLLAFGAQIASPAAIKLPAYDATGQPCSTFTMSVKGGKGLFEKGKKAGLFFPHIDGQVRLPKPGVTWHLVEGPKDAAALHDLGLLACGLNTCRLAPKFARLFAGAHITLIPDRDRAGEEGAGFSARVLHGVAASVRIATLPAEFKESGGDDVRDVLAKPDGQDLVLQAIADAFLWTPPASPINVDDQRPEIEVTPDEYQVNDQAVAALRQDTTLFQRGSALVQILYDQSSKTLLGITRPANAPRIIVVREASLRERLTARVRFVKRKESNAEEIIVQVHPPEFCTSAIAARAYWPEIRCLEGVISSPILRSDGSVLQTPGYDAFTGLFYQPAGEVVPVPEAPSREDARAACDLLLEVIVDFPFAKPVHRSAWLAFALTPLARHAFHGPSPLFLMDSNIRGSGKSLLGDAASLIVTGREIARMSCPENDDEVRKRITAIVLAADQMVLIDNIAGELGSASLDAALTGTAWKDRILGRSEITEMPLKTTWAATGNNVILRADTSRRVCPIRLESDLENPEERQGFAHPNLLQWVRQQRPRLLAAGLTILAAYCRAGRPAQGLKPWGSFEGWSDLVRQALVWVGMPDPGDSREELRRSSDQEATALRALIEGWPEIDPSGVGLSAAKLLERLEQSPGQFEAIRNALLELCPVPSGKFPGVRSIGNKLRHLRGRVVGGKAIAKRESHGTTVWFVADVRSGHADAAA